MHDTDKDEGTGIDSHADLPLAHGNIPNSHSIGEHSEIYNISIIIVQSIMLLH